MLFLSDLATWWSNLPQVNTLDVLGGLLAGLLALMLLTWPRPRPRIGRAHLSPKQPTGGAVTMGDPFFLRLAAYLFRPWSVQLAHWYRPQQRIRQQQRLMWAGLEQVSLGAWVGFHLLSAGLGLLATALVLLLLGVPPVIGLFLMLVGGGFYFLLPDLWLTSRLRRRDRLMESQLVPWLRAIASQLRASTPLVDAIRSATEILQRNDYRLLPAGLTDLYAEATLMSSRMDQGQLATDALAQMAERCPQSDVRSSLLGMRRALLLGSALADTLTHQSRIAQQRIRSRRLRALGRRLTFVTGLTVVAAFLLYVGSIGGVLVVGIIKGFSALP